VTSSSICGSSRNVNALLNLRFMAVAAVSKYLRIFSDGTLPTPKLDSSGNRGMMKVAPVDCFPARSSRIQYEVSMSHQPPPGEVPEFYVHIPKNVWFLLHRDSKFKENWHNREPLAKRRYHLTVCCLTRGLTDRQMLTVLWIWHDKHGITLDEAEFWEKVYPFAADYARPLIMKHHANEYWADVRRIQFDPKSRQHSKLRVAYHLMNVVQATAREIHEKTGIPLKTVRNSLASLQDDGKVTMTTYGVYQAHKNFRWDRATVVADEAGTYVWEDEHPALYSWGQTINEAEMREDGAWSLKCYDYCGDRAISVVFDGDQRFSELYPNPGEIEWVLDGDGRVVENGTGLPFTSLLPEFQPWEIVGHRNGDKLDFRYRNLIMVGSKLRSPSQREDVDFYARLCA
jgi:hypothetical protein